MQFSLEGQIIDYKQIPVTWAFEYYCGLENRLLGQTEVIRSIFKEEKRPSMKIYVNSDDVYKYTCYSCGNKGSHIDLVMAKYSIPFREAISLMLKDYNEYVLNQGETYTIAEYKEAAKYKVSDYKIREKWNVLDRDFWLPFNIGSSLLERYEVKPLEWFEMKKEGSDPFRVEGEYIYSYFSGKELARIYRPKYPDNKFVTVTGYIQGSNQLKGYDTLIWTSSMKDIMAIASLGLKVDLEAPNGENSFFPKAHVEKRMQEYRYVMNLLDWDTTGISAGAKYQEEYGIIPIYISLSKDPSDSIRDHGVQRVLESLVPSIQKVKELIDERNPVEQKEELVFNPTLF